ncbi:unnamed protein product, partial [Heterosigma akashiwo]
REASATLSTTSSAPSRPGPWRPGERSAPRSWKASSRHPSTARRRTSIAAT